MRKLLDYLFKFSAGLAAFFLIAIALLILAQSIGRVLGIAVHDANEMAGFALAAGCAASFLGGYFAWWVSVLAEESYSYGDTSPGVLAFPLWIPQAAMAFGLIVFTIAMIEALVDTVCGRAPAFARGEAVELNE